MGYFKNNRLSMSLENDSSETTPEEGVPVAQTEAEFAPTSLETDLLETAEAGAEAADGVEEVEVRSEAEDGVEGLEEVVTESLRNNGGGLDHQTARQVFASLERYRAMVGMAPIPERFTSQTSLESFRTVNTRQAATTNYALEAIGQTLKDMGAKIWEAIKEAFNKLVAFLRNIFGTAERLKKRAETVISKGAASKGSKKEDQLKNGKLFRKLSADGKVDASPAGLQLVHKLLEQGAKYQADLSEGVTKLLEDIGKTKGNLSENALQSYAKLVEFSWIWENGTGGSKEKDGMKVFFSKTMPGEVTLVASVPKEDLAKASAEEVSKINAMVDTGEGKEGESVPALDDSGIKAIAEAVKKIAEAIIAGRSIADKVGSAANRIKANGYIPFQGERSDVTKALLRKTPLMLHKPYGQFVSYAISTGKLHLDWCELSLRNLGVEGAGAPKEPGTAVATR